MAKRDFYETLGLKKGASEAELKRAYRKLARKHHPDVNPGDKVSEDQFKELTEAYEVLSDADKRREYDRFGHAPLGGGGPGGGGPFGWGGQSGGPGGGMDFGDIFGDLFGGGGARSAGPRRGTDLEYKMDIAFAEAIQGADKEINFRRAAPCEPCGGLGHERGGSGGSCPDCGGRGRVEARMGPIATQQPCSRCRGSGQLPGPTCKTCGGSGSKEASERLRVKIPAGVNTGSKVRVAGHGEAGKQGGRPGDLFIRVRVRSDDRFRREGDNIVTPVRIPLADALLGGRIRVETLDEPVNMKIPAGTQNGQKFRFKGKGVKGKGDLYAEVQVDIPKALDPEVRDALEKLRDQL